MRRTLKRVGVALAGALLATAVVSAPANAEPAALSGTITGDDTGTPVQACVDVYDVNYNWAGSSCTDEAGHWAVDGLESGVAYKVSANTWDGSHAGEWAQNALSFDTAAEFVAPATVDIALAPAGTITGHLTRADGSPAAWASVTFWTPDLSTQVSSTTVWDDGSFWATLPAGDYKVQFQDWPAEQWARGKKTGEEAAVIHVTAGETTIVSDHFGQSASVEGTISSAVDGSPISGACVTVQTYPVDDNSMWVGESCTDDSGAYSVPIAAGGTYAVVVRDDSGRFVGEYSGDTTDPAKAAPIEVVDGEKTQFDASLAKGASITGLAVDGKLGTPIEGACPFAYVGRDGGYVRGQVIECSGTDGRWTIKGLPAGAYALFLNTSGGTSYMAGTWTFKATSQATADLITVRAGQDQTIRNVKLEPGGMISGRVTDQFGNPVAGVYVDATGRLPGRAGPGEGIYDAQTDADGRYTIVGVPAGTYTPVVYPDYQNGQFAPEWSGDADNLATAKPLTVKAGKSTTMDAQLAPGGTITGRVVTASGDPVTTWLDGDIYDASGQPVGSVWWDGTTMHVTALPGGDFYMSFTNWDTRETVWFDGARSRAAATPIHLQRGETKDITFHLP